MTLLFLLKDTGNDCHKIYEEEGDPLDLKNIEFLWSEGNYSCDCNRGIFFYGKEYLEWCGTGRFFLESVKVKETGQTLCTNESWRL